MSADNTIAILRTVRNYKRHGIFSERCQPYYVWRVQEVQAFEENLAWFEENQPYNVGAYLQSTFDEAKIFLDIASALEYAHELDDKVQAEYGVQILRTEYVLFEDR